MEDAGDAWDARYFINFTATAARDLESSRS